MKQKIESLRVEIQTSMENTQTSRHILVEEYGTILVGRTLGMELCACKAVALAVNQTKNGVGTAYINTNGELFFHSFK